ncbi:hypothetical protein GMMP1_1330010 [Candidatus Magnetomoraceae bacterium gMMP-1]
MEMTIDISDKDLKKEDCHNKEKAENCRKEYESLRAELLY